MPWPFILAAFAVLVLFAVASHIFKSQILEGVIIAKDIGLRNEKVDDSFVVIETDDKERIILKFETHDPDVLVKFGGGESFHGHAKALDKAMFVGHRIKIETLDRDGLTRNVHKLIAISALRN